ncbi:MAG: hypothetical protein JWN40_2937 [Phycisphaerales bacterium]|nr:hypothetical protein [Phycisphaerales bacterium]
MGRKRKKRQTRAAPSAATRSGPAIQLRQIGEIRVSYQPDPPKAPEGKHIHARRPLPAVPEPQSEQDP